MELKNAEKGNQNDQGLEPSSLRGEATALGPFSLESRPMEGDKIMHGVERVGRVEGSSSFRPLSQGGGRPMKLVGGTFRAD